MKRARQHGTTAEYSNHKCRCRRCRRAWNAYINGLRRSRTLEPDDPRHGRYTTYGNYACRCQACTEAWRKFYAEKRRERAQAREARQAEG